jgi:hypothetical protein
VRSLLLAFKSLHVNCHTNSVNHQT